MQTHFVFRQMESSTALRGYAEERLEKIKRYFSEPLRVSCTFTVDKVMHIAAFDVTLRNGLALHALVQAALPLFRPGSTVFFLSSRGGRVVIPNYAAIGIGKALAESLVRYLAVELAPRGVRINCIAPSVVETAAVRAVFGDKTEGIMRHAAEDNPSGRAVQPEDYTNLIRYLASPAAAFIQGQVIYVNGGHNLMG